MRISKRLITKAKKFAKLIKVPTCWSGIDNVWGDVRGPIMPTPAFSRGLESIRLESIHPPQHFGYNYYAQTLVNMEKSAILNFDIDKWVSKYIYSKGV